MAAVVNKSLCTGCGACATACPVEAITVTDKADVNADTCIDCGTCVDECPAKAITV